MSPRATAPDRSDGHAHGHDASQALAELETLINRKFDEE